MSISSEHVRRKKTVTDANGNHIPVSEWTDADSVTFENGLQLDELIKPILKDDYEALSDEEKNNGALYFIPDDDASASTINYDNSASELSSTDTQGAIDELAKPSYSESSTLTKLTSGEKITTAFGKLAKTVSSLISHLADKVSHITSAERTKWNGYESTISTNTTNIANNATAISSLNSDLDHIQPVDDITGQSFQKNFHLLNTGDRDNLVNYSSFFSATNIATEFTNVPTGLLNQTIVIGYREVLWRSSSHVLVKVTEFYPVYGREHFDFYNSGSWRGWKSITPT